MLYGGFNDEEYPMRTETLHREHAEAIQQLQGVKNLNTKQGPDIQS